VTLAVRIWQALRRLGDVTAELYRRFGADRCQLLAAAVSFYMLLLGVPLMLLGVTVLSYVIPSPQRAEEFLGRATAYFLPPALTPTAPSLHRAVHLPTLHLATGGLSLLLLLWAGLRLFETLEWALTALWPQGRSYGRRKLVALAALVLAGVLAMLLGAASFVTAGIQRTLHIGLHLPPALRVWPLASQATSALVALLIFYFIYRYVPPVRMCWRAALLGALLASVCWSISQYVFALVVGRIVDPSVVYGQMTATFLFVWWLYFSAGIMFLGAEAAKMYQEARGQPPTLPLKTAGAE